MNELLLFRWFVDTEVFLQTNLVSIRVPSVSMKEGVLWIVVPSFTS